MLWSDKDLTPSYLFEHVASVPVSVAYGQYLSATPRGFNKLSLCPPHDAIQSSILPASSGSCAEISPFSLRGTLNTISTSPLQGLTPAVAQRKDGLFPLLHAGAHHEHLTRHSSRSTCIGHRVPRSSSLRPSLQVVLHTWRAALLHHKLRATVTCAFSQCNCRVHP